MLEITTLLVFIGYLFYLRYYADQRTAADKEADRLREGIDLFISGRMVDALNYFSQQLKEHPRSSVAYLYRARCYRALGEIDDAVADLNQGKSFDDTIADLHLESGKIHFDKQEYQAAFQDFDKAIFHSQGESAAAYEWRGKARFALHQPDEAQQDLKRAAGLIENAANALPANQPGAFVDRQLVRHMILTLFTNLMLLYIIGKSPVIHWPYLVAAFSAAAIGYIEPRKGWLLAVQQAITLWVGFTFFVEANLSSVQHEVSVFSLYGSIGLTFIGSFIGSILKRAQG